uniref:Teneurin N-terminal domain-containing protein n=1 Tax=Gongylonema pulchrum TaxID=637853 RepID=A0A183DB58_9BILA
LYLFVGQEGTEDAESQSSQRVGAGHSPPRSQLTESSALHYGSEFDVSSHIGSTALSQRSAPRHVRADINCAPSHHRTIRIDNMEVGLKFLNKIQGCPEINRYNFDLNCFTHRREEILLKDK